MLSITCIFIQYSLLGPSDGQDGGGIQYDRYTTANFQATGYFDRTVYMRYQTIDREPTVPLAKIGDGLSQFTMCMWIFINFLRGKKTTFVSYASEASVDSFYGGRIQYKSN